MLRVDDPRSEPRALHELKQNKMAEDAKSDIAIRFVDENNYREISAKAVSAKRKFKKNPFLSCIELTVQQGNTLNILSGSFIIYRLKRVISGLIFILLQVFYYSTKITLGFLLALLGSFSNDDGDGKEDVKKAIGLLRKNNNFARASRFFVHFFTVLARLRRENACVK